jgi:hypothetical protein
MLRKAAFLCHVATVELRGLASDNGGPRDRQYNFGNFCISVELRDPFGNAKPGLAHPLFLPRSALGSDSLRLA